MSTRDQTSRSPIPSIDVELDRNVEYDLSASQVVAQLNRIERAMSALEEKLEGIERCLGDAKGSKKGASSKHNPRGMLTGLLLKGWVSGTELMEKGDWTTVGLRSFITKLGSASIMVETDVRDGETYYRIRS